MQSWCVPAQAELRFSLCNSVGQAFLLQWTAWPVFLFLGLRFQPGHLSFPELTSLLKCLRGRGEGIYCPQRSASSLKILRLYFIVKLCVCFLLYIVLYFNIKIILCVAMRRSKSKPNFLLSWLSGDTVLLNLLKFGDSFDLVRADPTDQTQYLRRVSFPSWWQDHLKTQSHFHVDAGSRYFAALFPIFWSQIGPAGACAVGILWLCSPPPKGSVYTHLWEIGDDRQLGCGFLYTSCSPSLWKTLEPIDFIFRMFYRRRLNDFDFVSIQLSSGDGKSIIRICHFAFTPLMIRCVVLNPLWTWPACFCWIFISRGLSFLPFEEMAGKVSFSITSAFERIKWFPDASGLWVHLGSTTRGSWLRSGGRDQQGPAGLLPRRPRLDLKAGLEWVATLLPTPSVSSFSFLFFLKLAAVTPCFQV